MGGNFPGGNFAGENFPRTFSYISSVSHIDIFLIQKAKPYGLIGERDVIARVFGTVYYAENEKIILDITLAKTCSGM